MQKQLLLFAIPLLLTACGGSIEGSYTAVFKGRPSMDGKVTLDLASDRSFILTSMGVKSTGTYEYQGDKVLLRHGNGMTSAAVWNADTLLVDGTSFIKVP